MLDLGANIECDKNNLIQLYNDILLSILSYHFSFFSYKDQKKGVRGVRLYLKPLFKVNLPYTFSFF